MNKKIIWILLFFLITFGCTQLIIEDSQQYKEPVYVTFKLVDENNNTVFFNESDFELGTNAFEAMKRVFGSKLKYEEYSFGVFITEINNIAPKDGYFWELFVDGKSAVFGISQYEIQNDMIFEWRLTQINFE